MGNLDAQEKLNQMCSRFFRRQWRLILVVILVLFCLNLHFLMKPVEEMTSLDLKKEEVPSSEETQEEDPTDPLLPKCLSKDFGLDVFNRMKTEECKEKLQKHVCEMDSLGYPVREINNNCPLLDKSLMGEFKGCYADSAESRLLKFYKYELGESNSVERCVQYCLRIGASFAGVEYRNECFCGNHDELDSLDVTLDTSLCKQFTCPADNNSFCGGFNAIAIYNTGFGKTERENPVYIPIKEDTDRNVKILFLLQLNGRNVRQITRLLKIIYSPNHLYIVHVDSRQQLMHSEMMEIQKLLEKSGRNNFKVMNNRFATIWGGTSLLDMFFEVIMESWADKAFSDWDYIFNLSECDYPVLSIRELEAILAKNKGKSFLSAHGYNTGQFLKKQGYNFHFFECENRMWRLGKRDNYPFNLRMDGGSDWVIVHKDLAAFALSENEISIQIRTLFKTILLPLEGFFHTLALNSEFCSKVLYKNLRLTNWKRDQGCRCAALRHIVDWCGCSPVALKSNDARLNHEDLSNKTHFFARKFDSFIDSKTITKAEKIVNRFDGELEEVDDDVWVNFYDSRFDLGRKDSITLVNLAKFLYDKVNPGSSANFGKLLDVTIYSNMSQNSMGSIFRIVNSQNVTSEVMISRKNPYTLLPNGDTVGNYTLRLFEWGLQLDLKEEVYRDELSFITTSSKVNFLWSWKPKERFRDPKKKTSPKVRVEVYNEEKKLVKQTQAAAYNSIYYNQHIDINLPYIKLQPGPATFVLRRAEDSKALHSHTFWVFPDEVSELYNQVFDQVYNLTAHCTVSVKGGSPNANDCAQQYWSSYYPDLKSQFVV